MSAGPKYLNQRSLNYSYEYLLVDKHKYKEPTRVPAKTYIDHLLTSIRRSLQDEILFPVDKSCSLTLSIILRFFIYQSCYESY